MTHREAGKYSHLSVDSVSTVLGKMKGSKSSSKFWGHSSSSSAAPKKSILGSVVKNLRK